MSLHQLTGAALFAGMLLGGPPPPSLVAVGSVSLPRLNGRIDHLAFDPDQQRLFVAALGNNTIEMIDVRKLARVRSETGVHEPQGLAYLSDSKQIVVANGEGGDVQFRDASDLHIIRSVALGDDADNVRYDAGGHRVFVGFAAGALAVISGGDGSRIATIALPGHPESFQLEASGTRIFVNVPSARQIAVVDRNTMKVIGSWPVTKAGANYPMALDEDGRRLFVGCRRPAEVLVYDTSSGKMIASAEIAGDADDVFYDAVRHRLYVTGGEGFVDVLQADKLPLARIARLPTAAGARTSLFVPQQNRLYVAVPRGGGRDAEVRVFEVRD